jgi:hypothetical protein
MLRRAIVAAASAAAMAVVWVIRWWDDRVLYDEWEQPDTQDS